MNFEEWRGFLSAPAFFFHLIELYRMLLDVKDDGLLKPDGISLLRRFIRLLVGLCLGFPLAVQIYLVLSITPFIGMFAGPLGLMVSVISAPGAVIGFLMVVVAILTKRTAQSPAFISGVILLFFGAYTAGALFVGETWIAKQREWNFERGNELARAVELYHQEHKQYPAELDDVIPKYLDRLPRWKHGFLRYRFLYWFDFGSNRTPNLKFCSGMWTGVFYSWDSKTWTPQTP